jgi:hypothetical protein
MRISTDPVEAGETVVDVVEGVDIYLAEIHTGEQWDGKDMSKAAEVVAVVEAAGIVAGVDVGADVVLAAAVEAVAAAAGEVVVGSWAGQVTL